MHVIDINVIICITIFTHNCLVRLPLAKPVLFHEATLKIATVGNGRLNNIVYKLNGANYYFNESVYEICEN